MQKSSFPLSQDGRKFVTEKKDDEDNSKNIWNRDVPQVCKKGVHGKGI